MHRVRFGFGAAVLVCLSLAAAQQPSKPPSPPTIVPNLARLDQTINGLDGPGFAIAYSDEAGILAAACENRAIQCWRKDVAFGVRVGDGSPHVLQGHPGPVTALAWPGGHVLASAGVEPQVLLWEMPGDKLLHTLTTGSKVRALAMSPDGKLVAAGSEDGGGQLWDVATGKVGAKLTGHTDWVLALTFSADGKQLASGGYDGTVRLWDVTTGTKARDVPAAPPAPPNTPPLPSNTVLALAFSPDGKQLAIGGTDAQVYLFTTADSKVVRSLPGHTSSVTALLFHPSGALLVSGSKDRTLRLWNPANGQPIKTLEGHTGWVEGATFLAQGTRLASVGADRTVKLWDLTAPPK